MAKLKTTYMDEEAAFKAFLKHQDGSNPIKRYSWTETRLRHLQTYPECRVCGDEDSSNHVHHLRYRGQRGASEQPGDLVTLCEWHHNDLHRAVDKGKLVQGTFNYIEEKRIELSDPGDC